MKATLIALILGAAAVATASAGQLHVTVYDKANLPAHVSKEVADNVRRVFRHSDIEVEWVTGAPEADEATLVMYNGVVSKQQEHRLACRARRDIAVAIRRAVPSGFPQGAVGMSIPLAASGLNVTVYNEHIAAAAEARNLRHSLILGYAIAHEIGHVLLRSAVHDASGLMAGVWGSREYGWIAAGAMFFTSDQGDRMRSTMNGAGCPEAVTISK
jgi:hypothetical protein